jgi:broad specificity phosphatase PhoE
LRLAPLRPADDRGDDDDLWRRLAAGGSVLLIRHASTTPGWATRRAFASTTAARRRNLSDEAARKRSAWASASALKIPIAQVYTSPWCRCRGHGDARLRRSEDWEPLSSFFDFPTRRPNSRERVKKRITGYTIKKPKGNVVMVTHNVNIAALTKLSVKTAEIVVVRPDGCCGLRVVGG